MADQNPTAGPRVVPIDLPPAQTEILRDELLGWLAGIEEDLATDRLPDPGAVAREADAFRRLLTALDRCEVELPDEEARLALTRAAEGYDEAARYSRVVAVHDAHHALLSARLMDEQDARLAYVIGRRMRRVRRDQELSQEAVAWIAGIHRTQISLYEHGERTPLLASFVRLAGGLGVSPCALLDGITWEGNETHPGRFAYDDGRPGFTATSEDGGSR